MQRKWSEEDSIAPLYTGRHSHACSLAHNGEVVVVAGIYFFLLRDGGAGCAWCTTVHSIYLIVIISS